ncbi:MAG: hypothetical protein SWJ54_05475 [Cyanobacteriota bacterium]|nr:hypothetical protein [Cyanobacteriota bacterium]
MLQPSTFDNRALNESFYRALINRFHDSLSLATQGRLGECSYGMAPSPTGIMTFMIVAPSRLLAEQLLQEINVILQRVATLMGGIGQVAICIAPPQEGVKRVDSLPPCQMACKIFSVPGDR